MSAIASRSPSLLDSRTPSLRLFAGISQRIFTMIRVWRARMRQRSELLMLNGVELRELSLTNADVDLEANKLFWERISLTNIAVRD
jgi:uncharacterized protein YjiS (DUF1127 family)